MADLVLLFAPPGAYWFWRNAGDRAVISQWLGQHHERDEFENMLAGQHG